MLLNVSIIAVGTLVGVIIMITAIGALLPRAHAVRRTIQVRKAPPEVWAAIHDIDQLASWRPRLKRVERLPDVDGRRRWREKGANGTITYECVAADPPSRLVTRIADPHLPFGGSWTYTITPLAQGCSITIAEEGEVYNPAFRFMSRFVLGHSATVDEYLMALGKKFDEVVTPTEA